MCHHTSEQIYEKLETVFQSYYSYLWMDIILTGLYVVIQESVEKETGKTLFNLGSCGLDIYLMMISEIDVMLLNGTLNIVCPVWGGFLNIPLPGEKTLQKL